MDDQNANDCGSWNLPENKYFQTMQELTALYLMAYRLVDVLDINIVPQAQYFSGMAGVKPVRDNGSDSTPYDSKVYVQIVHGTPMTDAVQALRKLADILEGGWDQIVFTNQCNFEIEPDSEETTDGNKS